MPMTAADLQSLPMRAADHRLAYVRIRTRLASCAFHPEMVHTRLWRSCTADVGKVNTRVCAISHRWPMH
jgi:hypothetical protein